MVVYNPNRPPIGFAHRGAPRHGLKENSLPAFERALRLGAPGLETDIGLTKDGVPVLVHPRPLRKRVSELRQSELPEDVPSLDDLYQRCGSNFQLSLDMAAPSAMDDVLLVARRHNALDDLWLAYWNLKKLQEWRQQHPATHLIYPTIPIGQSRTKRLLEQMAEQQVDALNIHHRFCTARLLEQAHERGVLVFVWGLWSSRPLPRLLDMGVDGVFCDDVEGMVQEMTARRLGADLAP